MAIKLSYAVPCGGKPKPRERWMHGPFGNAMLTCLEMPKGASSMNNASVSATRCNTGCGIIQISFIESLEFGLLSDGRAAELHQDWCLLQPPEMPSPQQQHTDDYGAARCSGCCDGRGFHRKADVVPGPNESTRSFGAACEHALRRAPGRLVGCKERADVVHTHVREKAVKTYGTQTRTPPLKDHNRRRFMR